MSGAANLWPWLAVAGAGALHGLNPCSGWALAAARGIRSGQARQALLALRPIALGHAAAVVAVAGLVAVSGALDALPLLAAGAGLGGATLLLLKRRGGLAASAFVTATLQGSGLMLVPAFIPLCLSASPAREITASGSLLLALAAVGVHMAAMLAVTAGVAWAACDATARLRGAATRMRELHGPARHDAHASRDHRPVEQPHREAGARLGLP
ncbi:hypothetical protein ACG04R_02475 [Roseateles sp. BYS78W]|uniref:Uncharacterized protein n=1 Tax=Pelomonas candidula TaxID=3299025 RepID=A0ABW7H6I8_9BURK